MYTTYNELSWDCISKWSFTCCKCFKHFFNSVMKQLLLLEMPDFPWNITAIVAKKKAWNCRPNLAGRRGWIVSDNGKVWSSLVVLFMGNTGTGADPPVGDKESLCPLGLLVGIMEIALGEPWFDPVISLSNFLACIMASVFLRNKKAVSLFPFLWKSLQFLLSTVAICA